MKKLIAALLAAAMMLTCAALAATHDENGIFFEYDDAVFGITLDEHTAENTTLILNARDEALENTFINISLEMLAEGEALPTAGDFAEIEEMYHTKVEQIGEWLGFKDVFTYACDYSDEYCAWHAEEYIAPVADGDAARAVLEVYICADTVADEEAGMALSDAISAVLDSLKVNLEEATSAESAEGADSDWYMDVLADEAVIAEYPYHAFVDINDNGVPVLFVSTTQKSFIGNEDMARVYLYSDGTAKQVMEVGGGGGDVFYCNFDEGTLTHFSRVSGEEHIEVYRAEDGELVPVTKADAYQPNHGPNGDNAQTMYYQDGQEIDEATAGNLWDTYATDSALSYAPME